MNASTFSDLGILQEMQQAGVPVFTCTLRLSEQAQKEVGFPSAWPDTKPGDYDLRQADPNGSFCVVTGHGIDVLDVDPRNGGDVDALLEAVLDASLPLIGVVSTPGGGVHIYMPSIQEALTGVRMPPGVDYQGRGRMVFAPPTLRPKYPDVRYAWNAPPNLKLVGPDDGRVRDFVVSLGQFDDGPTLVVASARSGTGLVATVEEAQELILSTPPGSRNTNLFTVTARLVGLGLWSEASKKRLVSAGVNAGLSISEVRRTIASGEQFGERRRRIAVAWGDRARASGNLRGRRTTSMRNTITYLVDKFTTHGHSSLGLSCRELSEGINCSHETAARRLKNLVQGGLLRKEAFVPSGCQSDVYSIPEDVLIALAGGVAMQEEDGQGGWKPRVVDNEETLNVDNQSYTSRGSKNLSVECQHFEVPHERFLKISRHPAFTRVNGVYPLPPQSAATLIAIEAGATTVYDMVQITSMSANTIRNHLVILGSAGLIDRHRGKRIVVEPLWGDDLVAGLDEWCRYMGTIDLTERRRIKHQQQREYYNKWGDERVTGRQRRA